MLNTINNSLATAFPYPLTFQENTLLQALQRDFEELTDSLLLESHNQSGDILLTAVQKKLITDLLQIREQILSILRRVWPTGNN